MLPPPTSRPFNTISYWVVRILPIFFCSIRSCMYSGFGAENGLWVNVQLEDPESVEGLEDNEPAVEGLPFSNSSKNGKSITQQNASKSGFFVSFLMSGRSVLYFSIASLYDKRGKGISWISFFGYKVLTSSIRSSSV